MRGKAKTSNVGPRPIMPPRGGPRRRTPLFGSRPVRAGVPPPMARPPARRTGNPKDREMEDTLKKLKEMSK